MRFEVVKDDPLGILISTKAVVEDLKYVSFNQDNIDVLAKKIKDKFESGIDSEYELGANTTGSLEGDLQLVFVEDVVNFCFWPSKGEQKWEVEWPAGNRVPGGWYALVAAFKRGLSEGIPILDPNYLSTISIGDARKFFRGIDGVDIPLLERRVENLREAGSVLLQRFDGKIINLIKHADYDAIKIAEAVLENFSSFRDVSMLDGKEIRFLKRAQITPNDFSYLLKSAPNPITNLDKLTAYADYKLPQILRTFGVIEYVPSLAEKVDSITEIEHDSREEIEIRAATIWGVELLRQHMDSLTAGDIDNTIWVMSQKLQDISKPYHRSRTIYY